MLRFICRLVGFLTLAAAAAALAYDGVTSVFAESLHVSSVAEVWEHIPASWLAARRLTRRYHVADARDALAMGGLAFALLLAAELALALALGSSAGEWLTGLGETPGLIGLTGQAGFALMPVAVRGRG